MTRTITALILAGLLTASPALAQMGGGMGGGGGGMGGHGGRGGGGQGQKSGAPKTGPARQADRPTDQIEIIGVITALDPAHSRVTIKYEPVDELNWPKGVMPFPVANDALLKDLKVGDKVRFKVEEHEIYEIKVL